MSKPQGLGIVAILMGVLSPTACEQSLRTGKVGNTTTAPNGDGACPTGLSVCGMGSFARCLDLQADQEHCGTCDNACTPGIACTAGTCQQVACTGPVAVSVEEVPGSTLSASTPSYAGSLLADINGDARLDLVTWRTLLPSKGTFQVALGQEGGGFGTASTYQASTTVQKIMAADSNADGIQDLYINDSFGLPCVEIWLGHADGKLTPTADSHVSGCLNTIAMADLNGDGTMDLVTPDEYGLGLKVYLANAQGGFQASTIYEAKQQVFRVVPGDWDGNGSPDLIALSQTLSVYLNQGNGTFGDEMNCAVSISDPGQAVIADFNRDGHIDTATGTRSGVSVLLGLGGCQFSPMTEYLPKSWVVGLAHGDLDGDGLLDLVAQDGEGGLSLLLGRADGSFQPLAVSLPAGSSVSGLDTLLLGEVTGDGKPDIVLIGHTGPTRILGNTCP
jgi:hypothetical protein